MYLDARTIQKGLKVLGFDPGAVDGRLGPNTNAALGRYLDSVWGPGGGEVIPAGCDGGVCEGANISPDRFAQDIQRAATTYTGSGSTPGRTAPLSTQLPAPPASAPFFRTDNPWAWLLGVGAAALVAGTVVLAVKKGGKKRGPTSRRRRKR